MKTPIVHYTNNNYQVKIYNDGTKVRLSSHEDELNPIFPESIDLKITNYCDLGCPFCHEKSTKDGLHGDTSTIIRRLYGLPKGVELALGGGNPIIHPRLTIFLHCLKNMGFIVNMTVNSWHLEKNKYNGIKLQEYIRNGLIKGIGISGINKIPNFFLDYEHTINHFIIGHQSLSEYIELSKQYTNKKILLLGYKSYGRGKFYKEKHSVRIQKNIRDLKEYLNKNLDLWNVICFDNLAIEQLEVKKMLGKDSFEKFYMGDDGKFTMYYDGVKDQYASSSISKKHTFEKKEFIKSVFNGNKLIRMKKKNITKN